MTIAALVVSIAVAFAVMYREFIHDRSVSPDLRVTFSSEEPTSRETVVNVIPPQLPPELRRAFWPRLRVRNKGRSVARRCEGILAEVRNPKGELDKRYDPLSLRWAIAPTNRGLEPLDIARNRVVYLNTFTTIEGKPRAEFATYPDPRGVPLYLEPGDYWLHIVIYGDNFHPVERGYAVHWDGKDYKKVGIKEMNEKPSSTTHWPWQIPKEPDKHLS